MATEAETLLGGSGWLPEPLRTPGRVMTATAETVDAGPVIAAEPVVEDTAADEVEPAVADDDAAAEEEEVAEPKDEEEVGDIDESSLADEQGADDEEVTFEPHAIAAE